MSVVVLKVRTPSFDQNTCVVCINIAEDNLCKIILFYLLFIYCLIFQVNVMLNAKFTLFCSPNPGDLRKCSHAG